MSDFLPGLAPTLTVSELNRRARELLEGEFDMLWVAGELSNVKFASSGHWYFCLKDAQAAVDCAMFAGRARFLDFKPVDGEKVEARARVTLYEPRGKYQLVVEELRRAGRGALHEAFEKLKARLDAEGLFEPERKRALPAFPRAIGLVTSPAAAALRDILATLARRAPMIPVILYPAPVQGEGAGARIAGAIAIANTRREVDVLVVARGGGSLEDLWSFNEEVVARAIAASGIPVVSGVGHETDFTIADFVADLRAPTPTAAAAAASPDRDALQDTIAALRRRLTRDLRRIVETQAQRLDGLARRLLTPAEHIERQRASVALFARRLRNASAAALELRRVRLDSLTRRLARPEARLAAHAERLQGLAARMRRATSRAIELRVVRMEAKRTSLAHLDPTRVMARGYSIVRDADGTIRHSSAGLAVDAPLAITFAEGSAGVKVVDIEKSV